MKSYAEKYKDTYRIPSCRLPYYNYAAAGVYEITICTQDRQLYFGQVIDGRMLLSPIGKKAHQYWHRIPHYFSTICLDEYTVMPNHIHGILIIQGVETRSSASLHNDLWLSPDKFLPYKNKFGPLRRNSISSVINHYKGRVTKYAHRHKIIFGWQPLFTEHIIRNLRSLNRRRRYIKNNPARWGQ